MSNRGMKYIQVLYDYDSSLIAARPMNSNKGAAMTEAYESIYAELKEAGITPILQYLDDNDTLKELISSIKKDKLKFQLGAPHDRWIYPTERAVRTFKNHSITILAGCDEQFPKYLWCQLVPQAVLIKHVTLIKGQSKTIST